MTADSLTREALSIEPPAIITEIARWGNEKEVSKAEKVLESAKEAVFGGENIVAGTGVREGKVTIETVSNLVGSTLEVLAETKDYESFGNIPTDTAKTIFSEAKQALGGGATYNRMLRTAMGIMIKEQASEVSKQESRERIALYTGVSIGEGSIHIVKYADKNGVNRTLDALQPNFMESVKKIGNFLDENFPIDASETMIYDPLKVNENH